MKPKEYLQQAERYKRRYQRALEELEYVRSMASGVKAIRYDKDQMVNYMIKLDKAENKAIKASEEYFDNYIRIKEQIIALTPQNYSDILYLRYISGMKLWDIADELNYDYDWIRQLHGRALAEFGKQFLESSGEKQ